MRICFILAALVVLFPVVAQAQDKYMQIALAEDHVDITTGFNGTRVTLFGTTTGDGGDVIVTLNGPERTVIVRKKERQMTGAWVNAENIEFRRVPSYYDYASTVGEDVLLRYPALLEAGQIGVDHLDFYSEDADQDAETVDVYRDALIRRERAKGFFPLRAGTIQSIDRNFFKVSFSLPPGVPTGVYTVEAMLVKNGDILARDSRSLQVGQVGFNARVYLFATNHSLLYGIMAVMIAVISGWAAFTFLRRD